MVSVEVEQEMMEEGDTDAISTMNERSPSTRMLSAVLMAMQRCAPSG